ncbi:hypothetical protein [Sulfurimonas marina]|uniref:Uncharacterized protein n=1 Tax=Sulfurimonas marina TaxID=2590551 RepID=A0A7M3V9L2_9BACT|nr:hypothetical protein [Sulfurimonas marina]QOP40445.1 hypothetical protein FJR03_01270 [Sulfurimonas marina]
MKTVLLTLLIGTSVFAQYEQGKIDMHGGKDDYSYGNRGFSNNSKGMMGMLKGNTREGFDQNRSKSNPSKK